VRPDAVPDDPSWPDASRFSVQLGKVRVQVVSATIRPLEIGVFPKKQVTKENYLIVRIRAHQTAGAEFAGGGAATNKDRPTPTLSDAVGRTYAESALGNEAGELSQKSHM